ncbi:MAG: hypothetical protein Ct9H300mP11_13390 [Chloroflexota bacterium]|nr:MAG: hypothetical protein Ct9H300mP11_13390 [Chloroflexota bacterium]
MVRHRFDPRDQRARPARHDNISRRIPSERWGNPSELGVRRFSWPVMPQLRNGLHFDRRWRLFSDLAEDKMAFKHPQFLVETDWLADT